MTERDDQLLTQQQVASLLQVSVKTLREMIEAKEFPGHITVSKGKRWSTEVVRRWRHRLEMIEELGRTKRETVGNSEQSQSGVREIPDKPPRRR